MDWLGIGLLVLCAALIVCPPKWDPAIRLKERNERRAGRWPEKAGRE